MVLLIKVLDKVLVTNPDQLNYLEVGVVVDRELGSDEIKVRFNKETEVWYKESDVKFIEHLGYPDNLIGGRVKVGDQVRGWFFGKTGVRSKWYTVTKVDGDTVRGTTLGSSDEVEVENIFQVQKCSDKHDDDCFVNYITGE